MRLPGSSRRRRRIEFAAVVVATTVLMGILSTVALVIYTRGTRGPTTHVVVIPAGTGARVRAGENPLDIPSDWTFSADDTLVLRNEDGEAHRVGEWTVPAHAVGRFRLRPGLGGVVPSTLRPSGSLSVVVERRRLDWAQVALPTLALGPAAGIALAIGLHVVRSLEVEPEPSEDANPRR